MNNVQLEYNAFGANAVLIEWLPQQISKKILHDIQSFQKIIETELMDHLVECIPAYASLTVVYKNTTFEDLVKVLKSSYQNIKKDIAVVNNNTWHIPVCYHHSLGFDLHVYAQKIKLSVEETINIHTSKLYTIYCLGFLPGFLYLGELDERLHLPRKSKPLLKVPKGSVGIGGKQTGIYPQESPGGWHIIGNCPVNLFDVETEPPSPFKPGDQIQFYPISLSDYQQQNFSIAKTTSHA